MKWTHEERKQKLIEVTNRDKELNEVGGAELFKTEFVDYDDNDVLTMKYYIYPWQRNPFGNLQGGMICYYIDYASGCLSWIAVDCDPVGTVDLDVNFIRGIGPSAEYILVKTKVISIGRQVVVAKADVYDPDGWLMATATANTARTLPPDPNPVIIK